MPYVVVNKSKNAKRRRKFFQRVALFLVIFLVLTVIILLNVYWKSTLPTLIDITQARISAQTLFVVNEAVSVVIANSDEFSSLLNIERDSDGNITLLSPNTLHVNNLARKTAILSQQKLDMLAKEQIEIPFGTISGIPLFSEMGPDIIITVTPIGAVNCTFTSNFESVGINQTLHRMYINVQCQIDLIIPQTHHTVNFDIPILVSESVIVGKVPTTYLQGGLLMGSYGNTV
ncbi:MAG: sporulation protein YunB [Clostridia bacterium]|nr:sporulation protein YunB [Clostridia bacterium]